jgi:mycofactocin precursor
LAAAGAGIGWVFAPEEVRMPAHDPDSTPDVEELSDDDDVVDELLVEEVSIDGMCGVY